MVSRDHKPFFNLPLSLSLICICTFSFILLIITFRSFIFFFFPALPFFFLSYHSCSPFFILPSFMNSDNESEHTNSPKNSSTPTINDSKNNSNDPSLNPRNPFYLHLGENPGATIVSPPLDDNNYHNWSRSMRRALTSKNKISFINGNLQKPPISDPNYELWERANCMVLSWINRTLSPHIAQSTISFDSAFELWEDLRDRFTKGNPFRFSDLLRELHSIQQGDRTLSAYFTALKILWDELEDLRPTPTCSCVTPCTCDLAKAVRNYKHMEYVTCFLKGLNDNYHNIRTQILLLDPLPNISRVYSLIAQQQIAPTSITSSPTILAANTSNTRGKGKGNSKPSMICTNCHKTNHTIETCYFKHGFPPGYRNNNPKTNSDTKTTQPSTKDIGISKEDYQHLVHLLQQSRKDNHQFRDDRTLASEKALISGIAGGVAKVLENDDDDAVDPHLERIRNEAGGDESDEEDSDFVIDKDDGGSPTDDSCADDSDASQSGGETEKPAKKEPKKDVSSKASSSKKRSKDADVDGVKKKQKKKKDPNAPKRALSGFMFFSQMERENLKNTNPGISYTDVGRVLGEKWKNLSAEEKEPYEAKAQADKRRYKDEINGYKNPKPINIDSGNESDSA